MTDELILGQIAAECGAATGPERLAWAELHEKLRLFQPGSTWNTNSMELWDKVLDILGFDGSTHHDKPDTPCNNHNETWHKTKVPNLWVVCTWNLTDKRPYKRRLQFEKYSRQLPPL